MPQPRLQYIEDTVLEAERILADKQEHQVSAVKEGLNQLQRCWDSVVTGGLQWRQLANYDKVNYNMATVRPLLERLIDALTDVDTLHKPLKPPIAEAPEDGGNGARVRAPSRIGRIESSTVTQPVAPGALERPTIGIPIHGRGGAMARPSSGDNILPHSTTGADASSTRPTHLGPYRITSADTAPRGSGRLGRYPTPRSGRGRRGDHLQPPSSKRRRTSSNGLDTTATDRDRAGISPDMHRAPTSAPSGRRFWRAEQVHPSASRYAPARLPQRGTGRGSYRGGGFRGQHSRR